MKRLHDSLTESAELWGVSPRVAVWIFWMPLVGAVAVAAARVNKDLYRFVLMEDGPIEWGQFILFALACLAGVGVAFRRFKAGHKWWVLHLCLAELPAPGCPEASRPAARKASSVTGREQHS